MTRSEWAMRLISLSVFLALVLSAQAQMLLKDSKVVLQKGASTSEQIAAKDLAEHLSKIAGKPISVTSLATSAPVGSILIGWGPLSRATFPEVDVKYLGKEEVLLKSRNGRLLVLGGSDRGTLYASTRLLHRLGVRWWSPWASTIPLKPSLVLPSMNVRESPAFEYRDLYWFQAFDADWAVHNFNNGFNTKVDAERGGRNEYEGFVHTYFGYAPPEKYFASHMEWYSEINGLRRWQDAQLCTTNPELRKHILAQVKERLRANPRARIISISQNDCFNPCTCKDCKALSEREGSQSALVLDLANYIGAGIEQEFPEVAVDTLAYQWSRKPPLTMRPLKNVIVRLCSIECNFAFPLDAPQNASFGDDIRGWSKLTNRLYIWNYTTDFAHYVQPHPDYFTLGPTIRFFAAHGAKGVFEQGAYQSNGGDMAELKAWVMAQLLWDPKQDDKALISEFLTGYYGDAAPAVRGYLDLMAKEGQGWNLTFASPTSASFLRYDVIRKAEQWWQKAEKLVASQPEYLWRVRQSHLPTWYVWLSRWIEFRVEAHRAADSWPLNQSRKAVAQQWLSDATGKGPIGWTPITHVNEGGFTPQAFTAQFTTDPPEPDSRPLPARKSNPYPPLGIPAGLDAQDDLASLWESPFNSQLRADPLASDGIACWMPGSHHEWAFQLPIDKVPPAQSGRWKVYVVVRVDAEHSDTSAAFTAGIYDDGAKKDLTMAAFRIDQTGTGYKAFDMGIHSLSSTMRVWVAPPSNPKVKAVWVDRVYLVRASNQ